MKLQTIRRAGMAAIDPDVLKAGNYDDIGKFVDKTDLAMSPLPTGLGMPPGSFEKGRVWTTPKPDTSPLLNNSDSSYT